MSDEKKCLASFHHHYSFSPFRKCQYSTCFDLQEVVLPYSIDCALQCSFASVPFNSQDLKVMHQESCEAPANIGTMLTLLRDHCQETHGNMVPLAENLSTTFKIHCSALVELLPDALPQLPADPPEPQSPPPLPGKAGAPSAHASRFSRPQSLMRGTCHGLAPQGTPPSCTRGSLPASV